MPSPWTCPSDPFGPHNLPYGVFTTGRSSRSCGSSACGYGNHVLDAGAAARPLASPHAEQLAQPTPSTR